MNVCAITSDGGRLAQLAEFFTFANKLVLTLAILLKYDRRGIDDHDAGITVDDEPVIFSDQRRGIRHADCCGYIKAAGNDGGVGVLTAKISDKTNEGAIAKLQHVRRRDIVGNDNHLRACAIAR